MNSVRVESRYPVNINYPPLYISSTLHASTIPCIIVELPAAKRRGVPGGCNERQSFATCVRLQVQYIWQSYSWDATATALCILLREPVYVTIVRKLQVYLPHMTRLIRDNANGLKKLYFFFMFLTTQSNPQNDGCLRCEIWGKRRFVSVDTFTLEFLHPG